MLIRVIGFLVANGLGLFAAQHFIPGFEVSLDPKDFLIAAAILAGINMFIRPVVKLLLSPFIILTLGLLTLVINGVILYALDEMLTTVTIGPGLMPLFYATILTTIINMIMLRMFK